MILILSLYLTGKKREDLVLSKILVSQALDILTPEMDFNDFTGHRHRLLVALDDFPMFGRISFLEEGIKYFAGYGIKIFATLNSLKDYILIFTVTIPCCADSRLRYSLRQAMRKQRNMRQKLLEKFRSIIIFGIRKLSIMRKNIFQRTIFLTFLPIRLS